MFDRETEMLIRLSDYSNCPGICNIRYFIRMQRMHADVQQWGGSGPQVSRFLVAAFCKLIHFCGRGMFPAVCRRQSAFTKFKLSELEAMTFVNPNNPVMKSKHTVNRRRM